MFFTKKSVEYDVIVGAKATINGDIQTEGSVCLDGKVNGDIKTNGYIILSNESELVGNVYAESADIFGKCIGNIETSGPVVINGDAELQGDVKCESIRTMPGCQFSGKLTVVPNNQMRNPSRERERPENRRRNEVPRRTVPLSEKGDSKSDKSEDKKEDVKKYSRN